MNLKIFDFFPQNLVWLPLIFIIIYHLINFTTAPKTQKILEKKLFKTIRVSLRFISIELFCFFSLNLIGLFLPATHLKYENLIYNLILYPSLLLFVINLAFCKYTKSKYLVKTKFVRFPVNVSFMRPITFSVNIVLVIAMFMYIYSTTYYNVKTIYSLNSTKAYALISEAVKIDNNASLYVIFVALLSYIIFRMYLIPIFLYRKKKINNDIFDVILENGDPIRNLKLDEVFSDYYVFSPNDESGTKHIISKEKILYLKMYNDNSKIITTSNHKPVNFI